MGLRTAGWGGDPRLARLGYTAAAALRYGLGPLFLHLPLEAAAREAVERTFKAPVEAVLASTIPWRRFLLRRADEAYELARAMSVG